MRVRRWRLGAAIPAVAVVMMAAACGNEGSDDARQQGTTPSSTTTTVGPATTTTTPGEATTTTVDDAARIEVRVEDGAVVGGAGRHRVTLGEPMVLVVHADVADEVHVHGYDHTAPVTPAAPAELRFTPDIPGVFEVELEERGLVLVRLEVA